MSLHTLADGHTHVTRRRGCIGEVLFAGVSRSLFVPSPPPFRLMDEGAMSAVLDTNGIRREKTMGNRERGWPGGGVGAVIYGICPQPHPFPSLILSYPIPGTIMSVVLSIE